MTASTEQRPSGLRSVEPTAATERWKSVRPYVQIARIDHWFKQALMLPGVLLALSYRPELFVVSSLGPVFFAFVVACIVASSNYVINEYMDAPYDRFHPIKKNRPAALGLVNGRIAFTEWIALGAIAVSLGYTLSASFGLTVAIMWVMGYAYNFPPLRLKELPYVDVLWESVNISLRLLFGWYALIPDRVPPISLLLSYWMVGAFFMSTKRFAEYRRIGDKSTAASYRHSFRHYDEHRLMVSMMFYVTAGALFAGIFIVRYKLELILCVPAMATFFAHYMMLGLRDDSPVQTPEDLHKVRGFVLLAGLTGVLFVVLMFVEVPFLYELFNVQPPTLEPLWRLGG